MSLFLFIALFFTLGALALLPAILLTILSITGALASFITANIILGLENIDISIRNGVSEPCVLSGVLSFLSLPLAYVSGGRGLLINWLFWLQPENFPNPRSCLDV